MNNVDLSTMVPGLLNQFGPLGKFASLFTNMRKNEKLKQDDPDATLNLNGLEVPKADATAFVKCGLAGLCVAGSVYAIKKSKRVPTNSELVDTYETLHRDPIILESLTDLQVFRRLEKSTFTTIVQSCDQLLFLEYGFLNKTICPTQNDRYLAFMHYENAVSSLQIFQDLVKEDLGNEFGKVANVLGNKIYSQLYKHVMNVLHLCQDFNIPNLLTRAPHEVELALKRIKQKKNKS